MAVPTAYPEQSQATTALVLGILGIICCGLLGIAAWVIANNELQAISSGRRDPTNEGTAKTAKVVGIVGTALTVVPIVLILTLGGLGTVADWFVGT